MAELLNYRLLVDGFPSITQGIGPRPWPKALAEGQKRIGQRPKKDWSKAKKGLVKGQKGLGQRPKRPWPKAKVLRRS